MFGRIFRVHQHPRNMLLLRSPTLHQPPKTYLSPRSQQIQIVVLSIRRSGQENI